MQLLQPKFKIRDQESGLLGIYKAIEYPGRICYGSTDKITEDSAKRFVEDVLMKSNHGAPLEHGAVYLDCPESVFQKYVNNPYSRTKFVKLEEEIGSTWLDNEIGYNRVNTKYYVSTNLRVLFENKWMSDLQYLCEPTEYHTKRVTVEFTCNIGVTREYNRHRNNSPNEESTRYCNYSKDKFGNEIKVIENNNMFGDRLEELETTNTRENIVSYCQKIINGDEFSDIDYWLFANMASEFSYIGLTQKCNKKPQDARDVLPLDIKSSLVHTAFVDDWKHFFDLRALGTTGAPHPQAKELAQPLMEEFQRRKLI